MWSMCRWLPLLLALAALLGGAHASRFRPQLHHRHRVREERQDRAAGAVRSGLPAAEFFVNAVDHFSAANQQTYNQRFWVNQTFFAGNATSPVFLYIEGEGAGSPYDVVFGHHVEMAAAHGALVIALEHRYYGDSVPTADLSTANLQWLSSQQALADMAAFHAYACQRWNLSESNPWISFGGSYPGALSAWARLKYPHLIYASVASSAPVQAQLDFVGYNNVVASALALEMVGGSDACLAAVQSAFAQLNTLLTTSAGQAKLQAMFNPCQRLSSASSDDVAQFVGDLAGIFQGTVQYNDEGGGGLDIAAICTTMVGEQDPLTALAVLSNKTSGGECVDISYADFLATMSNVTVQPGASGVGIRQWIYQTCTQFGYYQTCEPDTQCPFNLSYSQSLESNLVLCQQLFGLGAGFVAARVNFSNDDYGALDVQGSRIVFVDGSVDPWHALSVTAGVSSNPLVLSVYIPGTAHCADMDSSSPSDPPALVSGRQHIEVQVAAWLDEADAVALNGNQN